ncbi:HEAT repeat domain-containing protein [Myxococcaceae bacterium GXIMD 01537]
MSRPLVALSLALSLALVPGCSGDPKTPEHWEKTLGRARRAEDRERVVEALRKSGHLTEAFLPWLHGLLSSEKRPEVRSSVVRAIADVRSPSSVEPLVAALNPGANVLAEHLVNKVIASALTDIGDPKAGPALLPLLRSADNYTRIEVIQAVGVLRTTEAVEPLAQLAADESLEPFINKKAIEALGRIGDARAVPALMRMLTKERRGISFYSEASFALFQVGAPAADALLAALEGKDTELASWAQANNIIPASYTLKAAQILGDLRDKRAEAPLLKLLGFSHPDARIQAMVRMQAAEALGRMRSSTAAKPLAALLTEQDPAVRDGYVRALVMVGGRDALPALEKAAAQGPWEAREVALRGLSMLGDARELPVLDKLVQTEPERIKAECKRGETEGCEDVAALAKTRQDALRAHQALLETARACEAQAAACWAQRLADRDLQVVERAALELGRAGKAEHVAALAGRLGEKDSRARLALIQAVEWLTEGSPEAATRMRESLPQLQQQLTQEKGSSDYARVNEDLRRLVARLQKKS